MLYVYMRFPEGKPKALTFSYDDGNQQDKRLAAMFDQYGLKSTFNLNCNASRSENLSNEEVEEYILSKGHEVAVHGAMHRSTGLIRPIEGIREVLDCRLELEERFGRIIRGMAYPNAGIRRLSVLTNYEEIRQYLKATDIAYARTLGEDNDSFMLPTDFYAWMPTAHHTNPQIMEYIDKFLSLDFSTMKVTIRDPRLFYIWGHSYEFDNDDNWERMEEICRRFSEAEDIWYATNIEIFDYVQAYKRLQYSADGRMIYNPSVCDVWLDIDRKLYRAEAGKTLKINE